jgi:hypothetical protein
MDRLAWRPHPDLDFRTYRHPLDMWAEQGNDVFIETMGPVIADLVADQAPGDADAGPLHLIIDDR